ncbi:MAG: YihY family inner membrane protein [Kiritimatiellae bacterium]|nr:YihY family inner membrane protein [Kiritimatiellia bacterium]
MKLKEIVDLFRPGSEIWNGDLSRHGWLKRRALFSVRVVRLVFHGFMGDQCNLHASALTYYTLMSIIPLLALGLSLARVFGGGDMAREKISEEITVIGQQLTTSSVTPGAAEMADEFVTQLHEYADKIFDQIGNISFGTLGGVGLLVLLWMAVTMLSQVERSFNNVWGASPRTLWRKFADYTTIIIVVPFLALAASTMPVVTLVTKYAYGYTFGIMSEEWFARLLRFSIGGALTIALFTTVLMFIPNTRIRFRSGLAGGIATAILFCVWLKICMELQIGVVRYSKLYGGLAALPILLAWVYMSWQIILFGAELTFAVQHSESFFRDEGAKKAAPRSRWRLAVSLAAAMAKNWRDGGGAFDAGAYITANGVSGRLVVDVLAALSAAGIVAETGDEGGRFVLLRPPEAISFGEVFSAIADAGTPPEALGLGEPAGVLGEFFGDASQRMDNIFSTPIATLVG